MTERVDIEEIVQQGGVWGPILCSKSLDSHGKNSQKENKHLYKYKELRSNGNETTKVPPLCYIDDEAAVSKCGFDSLAMNTFITTQTELKRLNFNTGNATRKSKCKKLHVGEHSEDCPNLLANGKELDCVAEVDYLGDIVAGNAKLESNIKARVTKGMGIVNDIFCILENIAFGQHYFKVALMLRESLLVSAVLYYCCIWYNV